MPLPPSSIKPPGSLKPPAILNDPAGGGYGNTLSGGLYGVKPGSYSYDPWYMAKRRWNEGAMGGGDKRVSPGILTPYTQYLKDTVAGKYPGLSEPGFGPINPGDPSSQATTSWMNQRPGMPGRGLPRALPDQTTLAALSDAGVRNRGFSRMRPMGGGYGADFTNSDPDLLRFALARMKGMAY